MANFLTWNPIHLTSSVMPQWGWFCVVIGDLSSLPSNFFCPGLCLHTKFLLRRWKEDGTILHNSEMLLWTIFFPYYLFWYHSLEKMNIKITSSLNILIVNINAKTLYILHWNQSTLCQTYLFLSSMVLFPHITLLLPTFRFCLAFQSYLPIM